MAGKKLLLMIGGEYHPFERFAEFFRGLLAPHGIPAEVTRERDAFLAERIPDYAAVAVYTQGGTLTETQETGLLDFVAGGGGFLGVHGAAASWRENDGYIDMLGGTFKAHGEIGPVCVRITGARTPITNGMDDFTVTDELYTLDRFQPRNSRVLATADFQGTAHPMAYTRAYGNGRVFYLALGHDERSFESGPVSRMLVRGAEWVLNPAE